MFKTYIGILILISFGCTLGKSCTLKLKNPIPFFSKQFGSQNITFQPKKTVIILNEGEAVDVYCGIGIKYYSYYYENLPNDVYPAVSIFCYQDYLSIKAKSYGETVTISCSSPSGSSLYESSKKLPNCEGYMSYVIGEQIPFLETIIKSAVCYDTESFTLKYVNYIAYEKNDIWTSKDILSYKLPVDLQQEVDNIGNYFDFMSQESFNISRDKMQRESNTFFQNFEFDFVSIIEDEHEGTENKEFAYLFNIMWWRMLRQNNWHFFLDALKERTKSEKYMIYIGPYGNATMPVRESAGDLLVDLAIHSSDLVVTAPAYIWAYLKSLNPGNEEEFVVIAHNSPYVISPNHTDFCTKDICDEISWLSESKFGHLRRIPTFGYTFCCRAEEVAQVIDYFPMAKESLEASTVAEKSNDFNDMSRYF